MVHLGNWGRAGALEEHFRLAAEAADQGRGVVQPESGRPDNRAVARVARPELGGLPGASEVHPAWLAGAAEAGSRKVAVQLLGLEGRRAETLEAEGGAKPVLPPPDPRRLGPAWLSRPV